MVWDVSMEIAEHQTIVLVRLDGRDPTAMCVYPCLDVSMDHVRMHLNAIVKKDGRGPIVIFLVVTTAPMDIAFHPTSVYVTVDGKAAIVTCARKWRDVYMDLVELTHTLVSVQKAGKDIFVTNLSVIWDVTTDFVMPITLMVSPTFVSVNLAGGEINVSNADLIGIAPTKVPMLAACQMNVSVLEERMIHKAFATTPSLFKS